MKKTFLTVFLLHLFEKLRNNFKHFLYADVQDMGETSYPHIFIKRLCIVPGKVNYLENEGLI
jgi:hypothetical protein